jgi:glycosyltransferase involved in cell wall biosynthesis
MTFVPLSVYLITKNEAKHLAAVLSACVGADEIVIVDSGSTDHTIEIARSHGANVFHQDWLGFAKQKNVALAHCAHEWVLHLDGDEVLSPGAIAAIKDAIRAGRANGYCLRRDDHFMGDSMRNSHQRPFLRVYRRAEARWDETKLVHEHVHVPKPYARLEGVILNHYGYDQVAGYMDKLNRYSTLKTAMRIRDGKRFSLLRLLFSLPLGLIKHLLFRRMLFSGPRGIVRGTMDAFSTFLTEAMVLESKLANKPIATRRDP